MLGSAPPFSKKRGVTAAIVVGTRGQGGAKQGPLCTTLHKVPRSAQLDPGTLPGFAQMPSPPCLGLPGLMPHAAWILLPSLELLLLTCDD